MGAGTSERSDVTPLYDAPRIAARVEELAQDIASADLKRLVIVAVLKGSFIFAADLIRALHARGMAPEIDFIFLASYGAGTTSQGSVKVLRDVGTPLSGRDVILIDDILDSGRTLAFAKDLLLQRGANRVLSCVLIDKQGVERAVPIEADFTGFACPPEFVVGYGMDLAHRYRELPYIGVVTEETAAALEPAGADKTADGAEG
ncbi:Hypoxanthine phosphoribosyltransferase [Methyloligella halotolerans]|uniref:Hypoxanthine phosphoribosyltransferase n=1 Tax=Methyloligella halotolerans TaxID=1177755 RepID=A0A1E2RVL0_9HYPH|nr:hypoxanthine phosphoribosyltransferase [Methyloligella halotolerans]ODA66267.1 Hypoxanthine phosphoribosyltransferase [Methyloligella halotolerans]